MQRDQSHSAPPARRRGMATGLMVGAVVLVLLVLVGVWMVRPGDGRQREGDRSDTFVARRGDFQITIPASGELQALNQIEIKNQLETRAVITEIVAEGDRVEAGEILIRFNDETIRENIKDAEEAVDIATNNLETATAKLEIQKKKNESELAAANVKVELARLALQSWEEGEDVTTRQEKKLAVKTAEKELERAAARFKAAERLLEKNFISEDDYMKDEIAWIKAKSQLDTARLQQQVYLEYDSKRNRAEKESDLEQAIEERDRIRERQKAEIDSATSDLRIGERQLESKKERLDKWRRQLELCVVKAPAAGLVVYASSLDGGRWGRRDDPPQVGTEIHRNETIMVLPDVSEMIASVKVNEALSGLIEAGQKATITCDATPEKVYHGAVLNMGVLAEGGSWRDPNRRDYTVRVLLEEDVEGLKPSMQCRAEIAVGQVNDAVYVPVQAAFREGETAFVYVVRSGGYARRPVEVGRASELYVEIIDGLEEGEPILVREPAAGEVVTS